MITIYDKRRSQLVDRGAVLLDDLEVAKVRAQAAFARFAQ